MIGFFSHLRKTALVVLMLFLGLSFSVSAFAQEEDEQQEAMAIFNQGQDAHEKGDLAGALVFYDQAIKIAPEFPEAEYQRGNALLGLGKQSEAEKAFRRAVELREDWTLPMANLGSILVATNRYAEAEKILTKSIELDEKNFPAYVALVELRLRSKAAPDVLKSLLQKLKILTAKANPTASLWTSQAALERTLGDAAAAKASLNRALAAEPKNKSALMLQAEIAVSEGDLSIASEIAKTLAQLSPTSADVKFLQARIHAEMGKNDEALKVLDSIVNPSLEMTALRSSITASGSVNVSDLEKQLEKDPKNAVVLGRLCSLLRTQNPPKALDYCRRAYETEPQNLNHAVGFGAALVQAKQFDAAQTILRRILQVAPDNFTAHANLAITLFQLKRYAEAKTEYQWLIEKKTGFNRRLLFFGDYSRRDGRIS
jgi:tetratricopeptide (TPR) repeat protein